MGSCSSAPVVHKHAHDRAGVHQEKEAEAEGIPGKYEGETSHGNRHSISNGGESKLMETAEGREMSDMTYDQNHNVILRLKAMANPADLLQQGPVVGSVLSHLNMKHLQSAACVCKAWNVKAKVVKKKREGMIVLHHVFDEDQIEQLDCDPPRKKRVKSEMLCERGEHRRQAVDSVLEEIQRSWCEPSFALLFVGSRVGTGCSRLDKPGASLVTLIEEAMPWGSCCATGFPNGVVGCASSTSPAIEDEEGGSLSGIVVSEMTGVRVYPLRITPSLVHLDESASPQDQRRWITQNFGIPEDEHVKLLIAMSEDCHANFVKAFDTAYGKEGIAVAGAYFDVWMNRDAGRAMPRLPAGDDSVITNVGLAIAGDEVQAACVVLGMEVDSEQEVEAKLTRLKNCGVRSANCFGLMFACVARGEDHYEEEGVESRAFRKVFPNVPLVGAFGNGEIGRDFLPKFEGDGVKLIATDDNAIHRGNSTVFCLISLKK